jgi:hypothetical protein
MTVSTIVCSASASCVRNALLHCSIAAELLCSLNLTILNCCCYYDAVVYIQVLPGRTHPNMTMSSTGGFLLTGTRVIPRADPRPTPPERFNRYQKKRKADTGTQTSEAAAAAAAAKKQKTATKPVAAAAAGGGSHSSSNGVAVASSSTADDSGIMET